MQHVRITRGFVHMEPIVTVRGETVRVYESSAADAPHVWVALERGPYARHGSPAAECHAHLDLAQAEQLRDQLAWIIEQQRGS